MPVVGRLGDPILVQSDGQKGLYEAGKRWSAKFGQCVKLDSDLNWKDKES